MWMVFTLTLALNGVDLQIIPGEILLSENFLCSLNNFLSKPKYFDIFHPLLIFHQYAT